MTNKYLVYSTGNSTQYSLVTYIGKETKKEWICKTDSLYCVAETNPKHCKSTILQ